MYILCLQVILAAVLISVIVTSLESDTIDNKLSPIFVASALTPDHVCNLSHSENCDLENYEIGDIIQVYPGGTTRCIESASPYNFVVRKGSSSQVLYYYQGGGACWDEASYLAGYCSTSPALSSVGGLLDNSISQNKFATYTLVVPLYCSGDLFLADAVKTWKDAAGELVEQRGFQNAQAVLNWTASQQARGHLGSPVDEFVLMGNSAGAVGAPVWADRVFSTVEAKARAVVADSFVLFMPSNFEGQLFRDSASFCSSPLLPSSLSTSCAAGTLTVTDLIQHSMSQLPSVPFSYIQPKRDNVQLFYYNAMMTTYGQPTIDADAYYELSAVSVGKLNREPNFVIFLVESSTHCYTYKSLYYTANALSDTGFSSDPTSLGLGQWVSSLPLSYGESISSVCSGASPDCAASYTNKTFTLAPLVLSNELTCSKECAVSPGVVDGDDTCLFVTLLDQFGDGWQGGTSFSYWSDSRGEASSVVSMSLDCGCPRMSGCIRPSALSVDQLVHMAVVSVDESSGEARVPAYFWEVYWTVQVVQRGEWKHKYYGGFNTSLSFEFSPSLQTFEAVSLVNVWKPEADMSCEVASVTDSASFLASRQYVEGGSGRPFSYANETSSYAEGGGGGYHESVWVVTDSATHQTILSQAMPVSCMSSGVNSSANNVCLDDGFYTLRSIGLCDPRKDNFLFSFCGERIYALQELKFEISGSTCRPIKPPPTLAPTSPPSSSPSSSPTTFPTRLPSFSPTLSLATQWTDMVSDFLGEYALTSTERSVYTDISSSGVQSVGSCSEWTSFVTVDVARKLIDFVPTKLTLISAGSLDRDLDVSALVCDGSRSTSGDALDNIVNALTSTSTLSSDTYVSFECNNTLWKVGACSSGLPAVCVGCSNPCLETGRDYTLNCAGDATADALNVVVLDFDPATLAPDISAMSLVSEDKSSITAQLTLAEAAGSVVCAAYPSRLHHVPDSLFLLSLDNEIITIDSLRMNFTIINLEPSLTYDVFCGTYSTLGQEMSMDKVVSGFVNTLCCRPLVVTLASVTFRDNTDYPNALVFDAGPSPPDDLVVETAVSYSPTSFATATSPVLAFSQNRLAFSNTSFSSVASTAYLQQTSGFYKLSVLLSGSSARQYEVVFGFGDEFSVLTSTQEPLAPALASALFSADGTRVQVQFSSLTNRAGFRNAVRDCTSLFSARGLGSDTTCKWLSDSLVSVFLAGDGAAVVGDKITLRGGVLQAKCTWADCGGWARSATHNVSIATPPAPVNPAVSMSGSNALGPCDDLVFDISGSTGGGGRSWARVAWAVESLQANRSEVLTYLNTHATVADVLLPITVPRALLYSGFGYNIVVTVCNFLGACGRGSHYFTVGSAMSVPVISMTSAKVLEVYRHNKLSLSGTAFINSCTGAADSSNIHLDWKIFKSGVLQALVSTSVDPTSYLLPKYSLAVGSSYEVVLKAQHKVSKKYSSMASFISVKAGNLVPKLNVASQFDLSVSQTVVVDASASFDEDVFELTGLGANLVFNFQCARLLPSYSSHCGLTLVSSGSSLSVSVPSSNVSFIDHAFEITVFVSHASDSRTARTSAQMKILPSLAAAVALSSSVSIVMNPSTKLAVIGTVDIPAGGVATWLVDDDSVDLSAASLSPISKQLALAAGASVSRAVVSLVLKGDSLLGGSTYLFTLRVSLNTGHNSSSAIIVRTNSPPLPGGFSVTPSGGTEMNTTFRFAASRWEDVDLNLPLTYAFAAHSPLVGYSVFRSRRQKTTASTQLAAGHASLDYVFGVRVRVYDSLDGMSSAESQVRVEPRINITHAELSNSLINASVAALREVVHVVARVINVVSCAGAGNCTQLRRESCGTVADKCGLCLEGYYGESEAANSLCYLEGSAATGRRLGGGAVSGAVSCSSDDDCAAELMQECDAVSSLCGLKMKQCSAQCSIHGACHHVASHYTEGDPNRILSKCSVTDSSCAAQCVCDSGFAGESCELSVSAYESAQSVRHLLLQSYEVLLASENPSQDAVASWLEGLAGVAAHSRDLSEASKELLVSLCSGVLDVASGLQLPHESVSRAEEVLSLTLLGGASSSLDSALALLDKYGLYLVGDLLVGQNPTVVVNPLYRLSAFSVDGLGSAELVVGRSGLELATGGSAQAVRLPVSASAVPYKVLLTESLASMQSAASSKELYQSVPVGVFVDSSPFCNESAAAGSCVMTVALLNFEFGEHVMDEAETHETSCAQDEQLLASYTCPSGVNVTAHCNGTMRGLITSNCSVHAPSSRCGALSDAGVGVECSVLAYTAEETVCQCTLPHVAAAAAWRVEYVSLASSELTNASFTYTPSTNEETLGSSSSSVDFQSSVVLYVVAVFLLYLFVMLLMPSPHKESVSECTPSALLSSPQQHMDDGVPIIFSGKSFLKRLYEELSLHHRWSCVFFKSFNHSSYLRILSAATVTSIVFFLNSLLHEFVVESKPNFDMARICLLAACISVVGSPLFVWVEVCSHQLLKSRSKSPRPALVSTDDPRLESRGVTASLKELATANDNGGDDAWGISRGSSFDNSINLKLENCSVAARNEKAYLNRMQTSLNVTISRLVYLFLVDFVDGIDLSVLHFKDKRDRHFRPGAVSDETRYCAWAGLIALDAAMVGYTVFFALRASGDSQHAWCATLAVWLLVEVVFVSTLVALWTHVWLPSFSYSAVKRVKAVVIRHLMSTGESPNERPAFNAASHFFVSHRLAASLTEVESDAKTAVLSFATAWPREQFVARGLAPGGSATSGLRYHVVRGCVAMRPMMYDMVVTTVISLLMGVVTVFLGDFYSTRPVIAIVVVCVLVCVVVSIFVAGMCSAPKNESLSLMNKKWKSAICLEDDMFDDQWGISKKTDEHEMAHFVSNQEIVGGWSGLQLAETPADAMLQEIILGDNGNEDIMMDDYEDGEENDEDVDDDDDDDGDDDFRYADQRILSSVLCAVESYDHVDDYDNQAMI